MPDPRSPCPPRLCGTFDLEPPTRAIHDIANYARSHSLDDADELLTEFLAMLGWKAEPLPLLAPVPPESRATNVLIFLREKRARSGRNRGTPNKAW